MAVCFFRFELLISDMNVIYLFRENTVKYGTDERWGTECVYHRGELCQTMRKITLYNYSSVVTAKSLQE